MNSSSKSKKTSKFRELADAAGAPPTSILASTVARAEPNPSREVALHLVGGLRTADDSSRVDRLTLMLSRLVEADQAAAAPPRRSRRERVTGS